MAHIAFLQHSTLNRHINLADPKLAMSQRKHGYMQEKITPQSTMGLLNCVECIVLENLPVLIQIINRFCCMNLVLKSFTSSEFSLFVYRYFQRSFQQLPAF